MFRRALVLLIAAPLAGLGLLAPTADAATYTPSYPGPITINDNVPATPTPAAIELLGASGTITDVNVTLSDLSHSYPDDLDIELRGPDGTTIILMSDSCGDDDLDHVDLTFDDTGAALPTEPTSPCAGTYRPGNFAGTGTETWDQEPNATTLSAFNGSNPNGFWYLFVRDDEAVSVGTMAGWSLTITTGPAAPLVVPASSSGGGAGPASTYPLELPVSGRSGPVTDVDVTLPAVYHGVGQDLEVLLVSPAGVKVLLMSDVCGDGSSSLVNATIVFDDQAATPLGNTAASCPGRHRPTNSGTSDPFPAPAPAEPYAGTLSAFNGADANGVWKLYVYDDGLFDGGFVNALPSLTITTADVVAPRTTITKRPKSSTKTRAKVTFTADEAGAHFECKVDKKAYKPCSSPLKLTNLKVRKHTVLVRAIDAAGNVDATPAKVRWKVKADV